MFEITQSMAVSFHPKIELDKGGYDVFRGLARYNKDTFQSVHQKLKLRMSTASKNPRSLRDLRVLSWSSQLLRILSEIDLYYFLF